MKKSTLVLVLAGVLIGSALAGQFEPFKSWVGSIATAALLLGLVLIFIGLGQAAKERRRR